MAKTASTKAKASTKKAKEEPADEDLELETTDSDTVEETAPAKKSAQQAVTFGVADLVKYINANKPEGAKDVDTRGIRTLIRKMARDGKGRVDREVVAGNRTRYDWPKGLKDPEVKAIIAAFNGGELEQDKQEKLAALKANKAAKDKAAGKGKDKAGKAGKKAGKGKKAADDDGDLELDD